MVIATFVLPLTTEESETATEANSPKNIMSGVPATVADTAEFVNVSCTDDAATGVFAPITTTTVVALAYVHDAAAMPEPAVAPTLAVHAKPEMKLAPVRVMVLPT